MKKGQFKLIAVDNDSCIHNYINNKIHNITLLTTF